MPRGNSREPHEYVQFSSRLLVSDANELMELSKVLVERKKVGDLSGFQITRYALLTLRNRLKELKEKTVVHPVVAETHPN